jgi:hypothetical protein
MSHYDPGYIDHERIQIEQLPYFEGQPVIYVEALGTQPRVGYPTEMTFSPAASIRVNQVSIITPHRRVFLEHGSEKRAQRKLISLTRATHAITAGAVDIHPFHGAVSGTKLTPVSPGFLSNIKGLDDAIGTSISLVPNGGIFSDTLTDEAANIPLSFSTDSEYMLRFAAYSQLARSANPNQRAKDQASSNGLGQRWEDEFNRFNDQAVLARTPMELDMGSIAHILKTLRSRNQFNADTVTVRIDTEAPTNNDL